MVDKRSPPNGQNFGQCMLFLTLLEREMARHVIICWFMGSGQCYVSMVKDMKEHSWKIVDNKTWGRGIWIGLSLGKIYWAPCNTHHNVTSQQRILIIKWIVWKVLRVLVSLFSQQSLSFSKKLMKKKRGHGAKSGGYAWVQKHGIPLIKSKPESVSIRQQHWVSHREPLYWMFSQLPWKLADYIILLSSWKG